MLMPLPDRTWLFTLDQVAYLLGLGEPTLMKKHVFFVDHDHGTPPRDRLKAVRLGSDNCSHDWRISEKEFKRWCRVKDITLYRT